MNFNYFVVCLNNFTLPLYLSMSYEFWIKKAKMDTSILVGDVYAKGCIVVGASVN